MTITPQEIQSKQFHVRMRGFDVDEVDKFLEKIAEEFLVLSLEHKQAFERIDSLEKEIANYRNKEQAFQTAILTAQKISDEMQERSRRESEETLKNARQEAAELTARSREESETTLLRARQEAVSIKEQAESKSREMVASLDAKMVTLTAEVNRLVTIKEAITADLRRLLEDYLTNLEEGLPAGLRGLQHLPQPEPSLPPKEPVSDPLVFSEAPETGKRQSGLWESAPTTATSLDDSLDSLYEKIDIAEEMLEPAPMTDPGPGLSVKDDFVAMDLDDIENMEIEETPETAEILSRRQQQDISIENMEKDMLFTLEDPLDELEPSISIRGNDDRTRR